MVRKDDWKLVMDNYGNGELYNLKKDPSEVDNLFGKKKYTAVQTELLTKLVAWELRLQDPLPLPRKRYHLNRILIIISNPNNNKSKECTY